MRDIIDSFSASRFDNVAAGIQMLSEELILEWISANVQKYGINHILCSGGVFMNVKANQRIAQSDIVASVDVFPSCGDETNIFGAAFYEENEIGQQKHVGLLKEFTLGPTPYEDIKEQLHVFADQIVFEKINNTAAYIANALVQNQIVSRCSGKMEFGARSLGNRSILANPNNLQNVTKINRAVKKRDFWMPFAPAVLEEDLDKYFHIPKGLSGQKSPYMMFGFESKPYVRNEIICGLHQADHSGRPQTVDKIRYPGFHDIITEFKKLSGHSVVLNTSFNLHGYPIVSNSKEAIEVLLNSEIDVLVLENYAVKSKI
jgi:carbamoyltransferase